MYLKTLHLRQFRNYREQQVEFSAPKTILLGDNAQGKSNLLEAVELLATLRSHRALRDRELVLEGETAAQIAAMLERETGSIDLAITFRSSGRRTVSLNGESLRRQLDFLGMMNAVQFSSLDLDLVRGGPGERRNWVDTLLVQLEPVYAYILQQYNTVLRQRNALLKQQKRSIDGETENTESASFNPILRDEQALPYPLTSSPPHLPTSSQTELAIWDAQLAAIGSRVIRRRARVIQRIAPLAQSWHRTISNSTEILDIRYAPNVHAEQDDPSVVQQAFLEKLEQRAIAEFHQGTTVVGPHRDEIEFTINQTPARQYGSQGQQRTLVLALKLAELKLIESVVGEPPLLLLDDVLAELDLTRQNKLLDTIQDRFQTLITTTHLGSFDAEWLKSSQILTVKAGQIQL
ncbi:MAG: DNA replication/repair protein RecF [Cyanobacteria bacterium CRU_2_1]|nr:DNA replication/repair protein RecF [Cyanobacteria bacterium RU_5_0]NJR63157.1 DNA replication/repair protein RecF [Cyanobacteria bacterium CRU_2_1]